MDPIIFVPMDPLLVTSVLFIVGLFLLLRGGGALVEGASALAAHWRVSERVIGLTVVAIGTSLPELMVNVYSSVTGSPELAFGNIFGSNIANVLLILGVSAMILPLTLSRELVFSEIPFSILAVLLAGFLANSQFFGVSFHGIGRVEGALLLFYYLLFMVYAFGGGTPSGPSSEEADEEAVPPSSIKGPVIRVLLGIAALVLGGKWVVDGAVLMAEGFGMSKAFIGLTVVAIGTSLPELVTSISAALKKKSGIAVGNVVGSNIFNVFLILGLSGVVAPLPFNAQSNDDLTVALLSSTLLLVLLPLSRERKLTRIGGLILFLVYVGYLVFLIQRG